MNKYLYILILTCFIVPTISFATSGACSYHGGVNCSAGANYLGNAVCNDGFDSAVIYSDMEECQTPSQICSLSATQQLLQLNPDEQSAEIQLVQNYINTLNTEIQSFNNSQNQVNQNYQSIISAQQQSNASQLGVAQENAARTGQEYNPTEANGTIADINSFSNYSNAVLNLEIQPLKDQLALCQTEIDTYNNWKNSQQSIPTPIATPITSSCPAGYTCISNPNVTQTGNCPAGYLCMKTTGTQEQTIDSFFASKGAVWDSSIKQYVCESTQQPIPLSGEDLLTCPVAIIPSAQKTPQITTSETPAPPVKITPKAKPKIEATTTATTTIQATTSLNIFSNQKTATTTAQKDSWLLKIWKFIWRF